MPFPSFDEKTRLCERAALRRWKAGQEMSGHQNPVIVDLTRGFLGRGHKNISKCKSSLMSSPWNNLIKSTYERISALHNNGMEVVVISFTDWRCIPVCEEIQPKKGKVNIYEYTLRTNETEQTFFKDDSTTERQCLMQQLHVIRLQVFFSV